MKTVFYLMLCGFLFTACSSNSNVNDDQPTYTVEQRHADSLAIIHHFTEQQACWNRQDITCYMSMYHPDKPIQTVSRMGVTTGYDSILASYNRNFPKDRMGELVFDNITVKCINPEYSYAVGRFNLQFPERERPYRGWFSVLFEKSPDGKWYMISDHSS